MKQRRTHLARACLALLLGTAIPVQALAQDDSVADLLTGKTAGVQVLPDDGAPGASFSVRIRGLRSFRGDTAPLYVLDGVILNAPSADAGRTFWSDPEDDQALQSLLDHLDPADIDRVEILKEAAATALYGSLGGNGVVRITTRSGRAGEKSIRWASSVSVTEALAFSHRHHVSLSGSEKRSDYYVSAGYASRKGNLEGSGLQTASVLAKFGQGFSGDSRFEASLALGLRENSMTMATSPLGSNSATKASWTVPPVPSEGPSVWAEAYDDNSIQYSVVPHLSVDAGLGGGFRIKADAGVDFRNKTRYRWVGAELQRAAAVSGEAGQSQVTAARYGANAALEWSFDAGGHHAKIAAGGGFFGSTFREYIYEGTTFFSQLLRSPGISNAEKVAPYRHLRENQLSAEVSARAAYSYKDRYFVGGSFRTEKLYGYESKLGEGELYPSVNLAWDLAKEAFFPEGAVLESFKIHWDWGRTGMQEVLPYGYTPYYITGNTPEIPEETLSNYYHLRWNNLTRQQDLGVDFRLWDGRLGGGIALYRLVSDDRMAYLYRTPGEAYEPVFSDSGSVRNQGVEVTLQGSPLRRKGVEWTLGATFSYNQNEILSTGSDGDVFGTAVGFLGGEPLTVTVARAGEGVGSFYGYPSQGLVGKEHTLLTPAFQGVRLQEGDVKFIDQDGDGNVTEADRTVIGNALPRFLAGAESHLRIGNFTMDAVLDGAFGFEVANLEKFWSDASVDLSRARGTDVFSTRLLENGSYVRLASLMFSYDFPLGKIPFVDSLRLSVGARNLVTVTRYSGSAPYVNSYGLDVTRLGIDNGAYPSCRSFLVGLTLRF